MDSAQDRYATRPGDVIDAHVHLFSLPMLQEHVAANPDAHERLKEAAKKGTWGRHGRNAALLDLDPRQMADWYVERLDDAGVAKIVVMSISSGSRYMREVVAAGQGRVFVLTNVDPRSPEAPDLVEREMAAGFRGVKLLPVNRRYRLSEDACRPFFARAEELRAAITVHYGVTVDPTGDLRYADPIDLSPVARDFPGITFVIAHFGAGYLDQVLKVAYQCPNVCVDTSGTNNWIDYQTSVSSLEDVFLRTLTALGPERVVFGTDSSTIEPYRTWIKFQQMRILEEIGLTEHDRDLVLRANAERIFRLGGDT